MAMKYPQNKKKPYKELIEAFKRVFKDEIGCQVKYKTSYLLR